MKFIFSCVSLLFSTFFSHAETNKDLVFAVDLIRHGDRFPAKSVGGITEKIWGTNKMGLLTTNGKRKSEELGAYLRDYYFRKKLLTQRSNQFSVSVASTNYERTISTAESFMDGFLDEGGSDIRVATEGMNDLLMKAPTSTCKMTQDIFQDVPNDKKIEIGKIISDVEQKLNIKVEGFLGLINLKDLLFINRIYNKKYPENILGNKLSDRVIKTGSDLFNFRASHKKYVSIVGQRFTKYVDNLFADKINGKLDKLKVSLFFAHDSTIISVMAMLGQSREGFMPPYNSDLRFELYEEAKNYYVKILLNNQALPVCGSMYCEYKDFSKLILDRENQNCIE